jgi:transposase
MCHGILRVKLYPNCIKDGIKHKIFNRDFNASMNILIKGTLNLMGIEYLSRSINKVHEFIRSISSIRSAS